MSIIKIATLTVPQPYKENMNIYLILPKLHNYVHFAKNK